MSLQGIRLTTLQLRYPRVIHSEFMTHRDFSRNASSSRAVPVKKIIQDVMDDPYIPIHWGKNQKGMQADEECHEKVYIPTSVVSEEAIRTGNFVKYCYQPYPEQKFTNEQAWLYARNYAVMMAETFNAAGYHKQIVNRLLEPFSHINVVMSATRFANFFALRDHEDAMPEIRKLAKEMGKALNHEIENVMAHSCPITLHPGEWHVPYITLDDWEQFYSISPDDANEMAIKTSVARCARVSYFTTENKLSKWEEDIKLYDRLLAEQPLHATPAEHQGTPDIFFPNANYGQGLWDSPTKWGNFHGWIQYRKTLKNEYVR